MLFGELMRCIFILTFQVISSYVCNYSISTDCIERREKEEEKEKKSTTTFSDIELMMWYIKIGLKTFIKCSRKQFQFATKQTTRTTNKQMKQITIQTVHIIHRQSVILQLSEIAFAFAFEMFQIVCDWHPFWDEAENVSSRARALANIKWKNDQSNCHTHTPNPKTRRFVKCKQQQLNSIGREANVRTSQKEISGLMCVVSLTAII